MRPGKDTTFVDETGKEWKRINGHVSKFDAFRKRDAEQVENISWGRFLSCTSLTLKTQLFCMPHTSAGGCGIDGVIIRNCSSIFVAFGDLCDISIQILIRRILSWNGF